MLQILQKSQPLSGFDAHADKYQQFIDGLRAIAVVAVILFHLFPTTLHGGFVGVDVFFVISGYLITGQIRQQIAESNFSIGAFYARRLRRIAPPLLVMLLVSVFAAMLLLKPEDMQSFAKSLLAQVLSLQNFVFLAEGEYFLGADTKPLLHTWSLAIEEQFYVFWPLLLLLMRRMRQATMLALIAALMLGSFVVNNQLISLSPKSSFFLLPTRAWELAFGGLAALLRESRDGPWQLPPGGAAAASSAGLFLILFSILYIDSTMPFPGNVALLPVMGTFLVVLYSGAGRLTQQALISRPMVAIGLVSYPLYLWHWPIMVFMHHYGMPTASLGGVTLFFALTVGLTLVSYHYVEAPIRHRRWLASTGALCTAVGTCVAALGLFAIHTLQTQGALYRFGAEARPFLATSFDAQADRCGIIYRALHPKAEVCELVPNGSSDQRVMLWGNSHADMWTTALADMARDRGAALYLNAKNCRGTDDSTFCGLAVQERVLKDLRERRVTDVVLASSWHGHYGVADDVFENSLDMLVERIAAMGMRIWLVIDVPAGQQLAPLTAYSKNSEHPVPGTLLTVDYAPRYEREMRLFQRLQQLHSAQVHIVDPSDVFCDKVRCVAGRNGEVWYRDDNHLTNTGARAGAKVFAPIFDRRVERPIL